MQKKIIDYNFIIQLLFICWIVAIIIFGENKDKIVYSDIVSILLIVATGIDVLKRKKIKIHSALIILFIFTGYSFTSVLWAVYPEVALQRAMTVGILSGLIFLLYQYFYFNNKVSFLLKAITASGIIVSLYTINYYGIAGFIEKLQNGFRIGREFINPNTLGMFCAITVILLIFYAEMYRSKILYIITFLPLIIVFGSGSKKALIGVFFGIITIYYLKIRVNKNLKSFFITLLGFTLVIIIGYYILNHPMFSLIQKRFISMLGIFDSSNNTKVDGSTKERLEMIKLGISQFYNTPIFGIGIGCSGYITQKHLGFNTYLHNNYVELLAVGGITGTILFYSIYFCILKRINIKKAPRNKMVYIAIIILIIQLIMDAGRVSYYSKLTYVYFLIGMLVTTDNFNIRRKYKN